VSDGADVTVIWESNLSDLRGPGQSANADAFALDATFDFAVGQGLLISSGLRGRDSESVPVIEVSVGISSEGAD
jgi:hypothetical protein